MLEEQSLNWALKHLKKYYSSDLFPKSFEYDAIALDWENVKNYILSINLNEYTPSSPSMGIAKKADGNYRIVHDLSPIDSIIYTSLVYEVSEKIESYRIPETEKIACSYRISPDISGSFFSSDDPGWTSFKEKQKELLSQFSDGFVLSCDIADFYNQIYLHRIRNLLSDAGSGSLEQHAKFIEKFLMNLNSKSSKGIPVGPAASIVLSELILGDIDRKILTFTRDYVRWVDDIFIFCNTSDEADRILYELTKYLYVTHRLIFNSSKTKILSVQDYLENEYEDEKESERKHLEDKKNEILNEELQAIFSSSSYYGDYFEDYSEEEIEEQTKAILKTEGFKILSNSYYETLESCLSGDVNYKLSRHIIKRATNYKVKKIIPILLLNFELLLPNIREVVLYLRKNLKETDVDSNKTEIESILNGHYVKNSYINTWLVYLLLDAKFNEIKIPSLLNDNMTKRNKLLLDMVRDNKTEIKQYREGFDLLCDLDKRALIYSLQILSRDERNPILDVASGRGDVIDKAIVALVKSKT